ncbi:HxlR family transcriptional regulator [Nocardia tenerifensis]|uniref:HxlR family transcriptional regulator n=1 Tax=Nocardia tenerifensis TaxID=228006 RepID=A0A318K044_9NOCA|nr:helix-turn-helix domain-containing protein [Nocardia tenerifensis]PXX63158.1 HxlR family transcriptional regulator [Nocardia tenerifensis]
MKVGFQADSALVSARREIFDGDCPGRTVLDKLTSRWGVLILASLSEGPMRFHVLRDHIGGISEKMLSQNLRTFTNYGLTERTVEPSTPPKVTYALTPRGQEVAEQLRGLLEWVSINGEAIVKFQSGR